MEETKETKIQRAGNVLYYLGLAISLPIAFGMGAAMYIYQDWLPSLNSINLFAFAVTGLITITLLEIVRRISSYVSSGKSFLDKKIPLLFFTLLAIFIVAGIASAAMKYVFEPNMEANWKAEQKASDEELLLELQQQFETQREEARECLVETQQKDLESSIESCEARYRKVKMGYDSCMVYGWHTMCLQYDDYEVIDCSEEALLKPLEEFYPACAMGVLTTKNRIDALVEKIENYDY